MAQSAAELGNMVLGQSDGAPALQRSAAEVLAAAAAIGDSTFAQALLRRVVEAMAGTANPVRYGKDMRTEQIVDAFVCGCCINPSVHVVSLADPGRACLPPAVFLPKVIGMLTRVLRCVFPVSLTIM